MNQSKESKFVIKPVLTPALEEISIVSYSLLPNGSSSLQAAISLKLIDTPDALVREGIDRDGIENLETPLLLVGGLEDQLDQASGALTRWLACELVQSPAASVLREVLVRGGTPNSLYKPSRTVHGEFVWRLRQAQFQNSLACTADVGFEYVGAPLDKLLGL